MAEPPDRRFVVGYALLPKKTHSFIQPSLLSTARHRRIDLVLIDPSRPLVEQGPFDCLIHKLHGDGWYTKLADFAAKNPAVPIVDQPLAIERLSKRITMLQSASELDAPNGKDTFGVPNQMVIYDSRSDAFTVIVDCRFPIIAKPLAASHGRTKAEKLSLLFALATSLHLEPPLVLKKFINHGGDVFKVYVAGNYVRCVRRNFLPDSPPEQPPPFASVTSSRASNTHSHNPEGVERDKHLEGAEQPPSSFFEKIARLLRLATGLRLFEFDMIKDVRIRNYYYIIGIKYFPGYAKLPGYEEFMTDFFWDMVHRKEESRSAAGSSFFS